MPVVQKSLFGEKVKDKPKPSESKTRSDYKKKYGKTRKKIEQEGRDARYKLREELGKFAERLRGVQNQQRCGAFLIELGVLRRSTHMESLELWKKVDNYDRTKEIIDIFRAITAQLEYTRSLPPDKYKTEKWYKFKQDYHENYIFTCHAQKAGYNQWIFISSRGRVFCRKCFIKKFSSRRAKETPLPKPNFTEGVNLLKWREEVNKHVKIICNSVRDSDELLQKLGRLEKDAYEFVQEGWNTEATGKRFAEARLNIKRKKDKKEKSESKKSWSKWNESGAGEVKNGDEKIGG